MELPIDFSVTSFPIKDKYIVDETPMLCDWMVFGEHDDGTVDITDSNGNDIFTHVPFKKAEAICATRGDFCNQILSILNKA